MPKDHEQTTQLPPPHNLQAEMAVLGAILFDNNAHQRVSDVLKPRDFYAPANAAIFDVLDRLTSLTAPGTTASFVYDGMNNRLSQTVSGATTRYVLDTNKELTDVLMDTNTSNAPQQYYIYGLGLIAQTDGSGVNPRYYHYNGIGSTVAMTDSNQSVTDAYAYDSFGAVAAQLGSTPNPFIFVGQYGVQQVAAGLQFMRARYYLPELGRFISRDEISGDVMKGQSLNLYAYSGNNPPNSIDPSGLYTIIQHGILGFTQTLGQQESALEKSDFKKAVEETFGEAAVVSKGYVSLEKDRTRDNAIDLIRMINNHEFSQGEKLNLVTHSQGGNIAFLASQGVSRDECVKYDRKGKCIKTEKRSYKLNRNIDVLITMGRPNLSNELYSPNTSKIDLHINLYSTNDWAQGLSGSRALANGHAIDIDVSNCIGSHSAYWDNTKSWLDVVSPMIKNRQSVKSSCIPSPRPNPIPRPSH